MKLIYSFLKLRFKMEDTPKRNLCTPPHSGRAKRLPKHLWGSAEARARKTALAAERQRRRRERQREEARKRWRKEASSSSSDEGEAQETPIQREEEDVGNEGEAEALVELGDRDALEWAEPMPFFSARHTANLQQARNNRSHRELFQEGVEGEGNTLGAGVARLQHTENELPEELDTLARELAAIKISSNISDAAMDKLMRLFANKRLAYGKLLDDGTITASYTKCVKPKLLKLLPKFQVTILLKEEDTSRGYFYRKIEGLTSIPEEYLKLPASGTTTLLRTECSIRLWDVKELYLETHGGRTAANLQQLQDISLSCDGVRESKRGSTTFIIVTARIGTCIYLLHIFDVLIGVSESKPSPKELLWYFFLTCVKLATTITKTI